MSVRPRLTAPVTGTLIILCVIVYLLQTSVGQQGNWILEDFFGLSGRGLERGGWWQPLTYQFLHAPSSPIPYHLLVNMLGLWFAGREVEYSFGRFRYLLTYLAGGILGGLLQIALSPNPFVPLIGASASVCAVLLAFTAIYANVPVTALLFFVVPVRVKAKYVGYLVIASSLLLGLMGWFPAIGHYAHLGGALTGLAAAYLFGMARGFFPTFTFLRRPPADAGNVTVLPPDGISMKAVLDKIVRHGLHSLTPEEMDLLKRYQPRSRRR